jgi:adenylate cyclase class 2
VREEREARVRDPEEVTAILEAIGLRPRFRYEKYRSTYKLPEIEGLLVEMDETPIGDFVELEGNRRSIDRAAGLLGYGPKDYIAKPYGILWLEHEKSRTSGGARSGLGDMLFKKRRARSKNECRRPVHHEFSKLF